MAPNTDIEPLACSKHTKTSLDAEILISHLTAFSPTSDQCNVQPLSTYISLPVNNQKVLGYCPTHIGVSSLFLGHLSLAEWLLCLNQIISLGYMAKTA